MIFPLKVTIPRTANWWLGNLDDLWFKSLEDAVREEWGVDPLRIREGGVCSSIHVGASRLLTFLTVCSFYPIS